MRKRTTTINEAARQFLQISRDDYALCSYVQYRQSDRRVKAGWCADTKQEMADFIGITRPGLYKMIDRLEGMELLHVDAPTGHLQVTGKWIDAENERKQSLQSSVNKVDTECKQSLHRSVNKVTPNIKVEVYNKKEEWEKERTQNTPPQNDSPTLEEKPLKIPAAGAGPGGPPNWGAYPKADTPEQLRENLSAFYKANPEEWRMVKDGTPAAKWDAAKTREVVGDFCAWAITEGFQRRNFSQINARLKTWFKKQPNFESNTNTTTPARPTPPTNFHH